MLSIFPQLLYLGLVAPVLLRVTVATYGILAGWSRYHKPYKWMSFIYGVLSVFLFIGLFTQIVSLLLILVIGFDYWVEKDSISTEKRMLYVLLAIVLVTFLFTGPGFLAFDLPL